MPTNPLDRWGEDPRATTAPTVPGARMAAEIQEQPEALARLLDHGRREIHQVAEVIRRTEPRFVLLAGRGTSDHAALYAKYLVEILLGIPAGLASPSTLTAYGARPDYENVLWLAVSQSGTSPDLVESTLVARKHGALTVAVTNAPESPLASAAQLQIDILAGPERAVAATKSYTSQMLALWLLVSAWRGTDVTPVHLPELAAEALNRPEILELADRYRAVQDILVTGRGYSYVTAREAALKLMETSYISAQAFSGADLLHGPVALVDEAKPVIAIASPGVGGEALGPVLQRLITSGANVSLVGSAAIGNSFSLIVPVPATADESLAPILEILPLQRLTHSMALARHHNPDAPRGLQKVTQTW